MDSKTKRQNKRNSVTIQPETKQGGSVTHVATQPILPSPLASPRLFLLPPSPVPTESSIPLQTAK